MSWIKILVGVLLIITGIMHFIYPRIYGIVIPSWVPLKKEIILGSGAAEVLVGIALMLPGYSAWGTLGVIILMVSFLPIHIVHIFQPPISLKLPYWVFVVRLPFQFLFIWGSLLLNKI